MSAVGAVEGDWEHYDDVIMSERASQITTIITIVYSIVYSDVDQRKHQSSASLAIVRGIHREPAQMASYAENVSIWWRHHERSKEYLPPSTSDCSTRATSCVVLPTLFSAMKWYDRKCCRKTRLKWRVISRFIVVALWIYSYSIKWLYRGGHEALSRYLLYRHWIFKNYPQ